MNAFEEIGRRHDKLSAKKQAELREKAMRSTTNPYSRDTPEERDAYSKTLDEGPVRRG